MKKIIDEIKKQLEKINNQNKNNEKFKEDL
jgi:hypothetical protein